MMKHRGFTVLEFIVVCLIVALSVWALIPRVTDALKLAHEQAVENTGMALRESISFANYKWKAGATHTKQLAWSNQPFNALWLNDNGYPIRTDQDSQTETLTATQCTHIWRAVLGGAPPSASEHDQTAYRVLSYFDAKHGLGCIFRYELAGSMAIYYFPESGIVYWNNRFEGPL